MPDLFLLRDLCSRPSVPINATQYEQSLDLDISRIEEFKNGITDDKRLRYLIRSLYEYPEKGIVILDGEGAPWESAIFKVWSQQWPRLRREFSFSTGSLGDRRLAGIAFDLQIAPMSSERIWRRDGSPTLLINFHATTPEPFSVDKPLWIELTEDDLSNNSEHQFRKFLFDYGSDIEMPRPAFGRLAAVYIHLNGTSKFDWSALLHSVAESFPSRTDAVRLKRYLVTLPSSLTPSEKLERAWSIVSFLLDSELSSAYPEFDFDFASSAVSLWKERRESTIDLLSRLVQQEERIAANSFAQGIARAVDSASLKAISEGHDELVPLLIRYNPALAFEIETWKLRDYVQTQIFEALMQLSLPQIDWGRIVGAMFIAGTHVAISEAVAMADQYAMTGAFQWLEHKIAEEILPPRAWRDALASPAIALLVQNKNLQPDQLALSAWCVRTDYVLKILSTNREDIQRLANESPNAIPPPLRISTAFLLLTIGLRENNDTSTNMVLKNLFTVHMALASSDHSPDSWWMLSPELPTLGWWRDWDRCEKLKRAIKLFLKKRGECNRLLEVAKTATEKNIASKINEIDNDDSSQEFID